MRKQHPELGVKVFRDFCTRMAETVAPLSPEAERARAERQAAEEAHLRWRERAGWRDSGIPTDYWPFLTEPDDCDTHRLVAEWLASNHRGLLLTGTAGRHKTSAACWAVARRHGKFIHATDLLAAGQFDGEFWDRVRLSPLLAVDEMGKEPSDSGGWYESAVYRLLNGRYEDNCKTLVISNVSPAEFRARYMPAAERVLEKGGTEPEARQKDPLYDRFKTGWLVPAPLVGPSLRSAGGG